MITFEEARQICFNRFSRSWHGGGEFWVADTGWEDKKSFLMVVGNKEWLKDGRSEFRIIDDTTIFVDKDTGKIWDDADRLAALDRVGKMTPVQVAG